MAEVRKLTNAERCSLFLLDPDQQDLVAKVFDGISTEEVDTLCDCTVNFTWKCINVV